MSDRTRTVIVYSDSAYSIGLLTKPWKAKKNVELVDELRALVKTFRDLRFVKVAGHAQRRTPVRAQSKLGGQHHPAQQPFLGSRELGAVVRLALLEGTGRLQ